jgi:diguanylate cyclase (GGDEF)-like protein/PAS domain S-box-containing protein/putative nucleotidyltransferase with HDIG domain
VNAAAPRICLLEESHMFQVPWKPVSVASRIAWKLMLLFSFTLTLVHLLGIIPDPGDFELRRRAVINESLAITSSLLARDDNDVAIQKNFETVVARFPEIQSACIRRNDGTVLHQIGDHQHHWYLESDSLSTRDNMFVPIMSGSQVWGTVELTFETPSGIGALINQFPVIRIGVFTVLMNGLIVWWYLQRAFKYLDPGRAVPMHVRSALDTFSEGVVVLDNRQRIVLANDKFQKQVGISDHELLGRGIDELTWHDEADQPIRQHWRNNHSNSVGMRLTLQHGTERRTFLVNTSPILDNDGKQRGTIASFDDITPLEQKRKELNSMLKELQSSRDELTLRNQELQYLATRDPLTGCLNRRTFFEIFDGHWKEASSEQRHLCIFMVDVDHFKSINDNHGHRTGDEVLRKVAETIQTCARGTDVVCRYGGEEFCLLLPETDIDSATDVAERIRLAIQGLAFDNLAVTASLGVSSIVLGAKDPQELLEEADKSLYVAKRTGRNQVVRWDEVPDDVGNHASAASPPEANAGRDTSIPYPAVASLVSALAYRHHETAAHSMRVSELCVVVAADLLSVKDVYVLEVAALLHDIGKIGVPDSVLLKPDRLTDEEWELMRMHERIGVEIVEASFSNRQLADILRFRHTPFAKESDASQTSHGRDIPIGARLLAIADAYDAMVSHRVFRPGCSAEQAFAELRRCSGSQFDPDLVEQFIATVKQHQANALPLASQQSGLQIGLQIQRMLQAVEQNDVEFVRALAARLETTAAYDGLPEIQRIAAEIKQAAGSDADFVELLQLLESLVDVCRAASDPRSDSSATQRPTPT